MKTKLTSLCYLLFAICYLLSPICYPAFAQGTAFTYQGRLNDGAAPANGSYDLRFTIYDSTNNPGVVIAGPLTNAATPVNNGLFTVTLDFGDGVFTGPARWLEIAVRTNGTGAFAALSPRQSISPSPYALYASRVSAAGINGTIPATNLSGTYGNSLSFTNAANSFSGNGAGLTGLNASQLLSGTVLDARLSANVALRNTTNTFTGNQAIVSGNLAVGTNAASARLEVAGQIKVTGGSPGPGKVLTSDSAGLAGWAPPQTTARVVTVDASGNGDYTTVSAALAAINPSATNPFVVFVRPGAYVDDIEMKSYVHLKGAGQDTTFLQTEFTIPFSGFVIHLDHLTNVMISGFTLSPSPGEAAYAGIYDESSSPIIADNTITGFSGWNVVPAGGIISIDSSPTIWRNRIVHNHATAGIGVVGCSGLISENYLLYEDPGILYQRSSLRIVNNDFDAGIGIEDALFDVGFGGGPSFAIISQNRFTGTNQYAIHNRSQAQIIGNVIGGKHDTGILADGPALIVANTITNFYLHGIVDSSGAGTTIAGNFISRQYTNNLGQSTNADAALEILDSNPVVSGNYFSNTLEIRVTPGDAPIISGNHFYGRVSVTASTVMSGNQIFGSITGDPIIAGFDGVSLQVTNHDDLRVNAGNATFLGDASVKGNLDVTGIIPILNAGIGVFTNAVTVEATLGVGGNTTIGGTLDVSGNTVLRSALIAGTSLFTNTVTIAKNTMVGGTLFVTGPSTFVSPVTANSFSGDGSGLTGISSLDAADGSPTDALFVDNTGHVGIGLTNPAHRLHVGTTRGTNAFNASTNVIAIEDAIENGRATFLALAGIGGPDTTNRVEVQIEAVESSRRGIIGTTTEHPVYLRVGNSDVMVLATNRFVGINTSSPTERLHVIGNILASGTITPNSDRNAKTDLKPVDVAAILERVAALPIQQWRFKAESDQVKHIGPMAQDFRAAFGLGAHETAIATVDADGVALAAIQGLNQKLEENRAENAELKRQLHELKQLVEKLASQTNPTSP